MPRDEIINTGISSPFFVQTDPAVTGRVEHVSELPALLEGVRDARAVERNLVESTPGESEGEGTPGQTTRERSRTVPGRTLRPSARAVGDREPTQLPAQDADTAVATPAERYTPERPDEPDQRPDEQPLAETGDGVSDGDTVGQRGRTTSLRGGVQESGDTRRRGGTDT